VSIETCGESVAGGDAVNQNVFCFLKKTSEGVTLAKKSHNVSHDDTHTTRTPHLRDFFQPCARYGNSYAEANAPRCYRGERGRGHPRPSQRLVVTHVLRSEHFDDPADLARLPAVSRAMRDTVAATGLRFKELDEAAAVKLGCLSAVQRLQRGGRLLGRERLCQTAARSGQLEELKALRADGCPWNEWTCAGAAEGGHLEVLQWARVNGCPWDEYTCQYAAEGGHLEVIQWAHERLLLGQLHVQVSGVGRAPRGAAVGAHERMSVELGDVRGGGIGRAPRGAAVGAIERL
jgi:hypothetical protein